MKNTKISKAVLKKAGILFLAAAIAMAAAGCDLFMEPPSAPTGVSAVAASASSITISWNAVSGANRYDVMRYTSAGASTWTAYQNAGNTTSYTWTGLSSGTHWFRVSAYNTAGESEYSTMVSATLASLTPVATTITVNASDWYLGTLSGTTTGRETGVKQYVRVALQAGVTYTISWQDYDSHQNTSEYTDITVNLFRESTGLTVRTGAQYNGWQDLPNSFTYTVPAGAGGNYLIGINKYMRPSSTWYDLRVTM
ncbi:MAG: fibronectin type III domain-containing protein [Treponema sp.]|nr:fibronectin type III domain-containing protein [Treponema sp.]MCL2237980.1 fibronectin type III domain-containing protein [Treponema sp.]